MPTSWSRRSALPDAVAAEARPHGAPLGHDAPMTRRIASAALAAGLLIAPLAGCSQNQNQDNQNQNQNQNQNDQQQNQNQNDQQQNQ